MSAPSRGALRALSTTAARLCRHHPAPTGTAGSESAQRTVSPALVLALAAAGAAVSQQRTARADLAPSSAPLYTTPTSIVDRPSATSPTHPTAASAPQLPPSPHVALLSAVAEADMPAVQALAVLANDVDNHLPLLRAGAVSALSSALSACAAHPPDVAAPLRVNLLRVLADLSKSEPAHQFFRNSSIATRLTDVLRQYPPPATASTGWLAWLLSPFGYSSVPAVEKNKKEAEDAAGDRRAGISNGDAMVDYLSAGLPTTPALPNIDLGAGIAYHAMRCLSNLARNSGMHGELLSAGVLPLLNDALKRADVREDVDQELIELLRYTILSVAALAKSAPADVVAGGGHKRLIHFMQQEADSVSQMYAAGGIRNLARHGEEKGTDAWRVHRELVVSGVVDALVSGMESKSNPQTQLFATLAFGDLMTTGHYKADIIRRWLEPSFASFAKLLREKNIGVKRSVYRTLMALFGDTEKDKSTHAPVGTVVPPKMAMLLAEETGQIIHGDVARGDVVALRAVRCMCKDIAVATRMVDKGLLEALVRGATKGKGEYWEESVAALSLLSGRDQFTNLLESRGALRAVLQRPCLEKNGRWSAAFFANMARSQEHHAEIAHGALKVLLLALSAKGNDDARREGARGLYNLSLGGVSRVMLGQGGALIPLVQTAALMTGDARRYAIGALAKISEAYEHATKLIEADIVSVLLKSASEDPMVVRDVALCLSHLSQVIEVHGSLASSGAIKWLVDMVSKNGGRGEDAPEVMQYATIGICNVAYSEGITRTVLTKAGAVRLLTALSSSGMSASQVVYSARQALQNLKGNEKPGMLPIDASTKHALPA